MWKKYKLITFLKRLQGLKQGGQKNPAGTRQTDGKNLVWFGEIEKKLAKLSKTTFAYRSSS
jgi:hypothetical protein